MGCRYEVWCERVSDGKKHTSVVYYAPTYREAERAARMHQRYDDVNRCWIVETQKTEEAGREDESKIL